MINSILYDQIRIKKGNFSDNSKYCQKFSLFFIPFTTIYLSIVYYFNFILRHDKLQFQTVSLVHILTEKISLLHYFNLKNIENNWEFTIFAVSNRHPMLIFHGAVKTKEHTNCTLEVDISLVT